MCGEVAARAREERARATSLKDSALSLRVVLHSASDRVTSHIYHKCHIRASVLREFPSYASLSTATVVSVDDSGPRVALYFYHY